MGIDIYGMVRKSDGTLTQDVSDETRAYIASVMTGMSAMIDDVRAFDEFNAKRPAYWDDPELDYAMWEQIQANPIWQALDNLHLMCLGRATAYNGVRHYIVYEMGCSLPTGETDDALDMHAILSLLFDDERAEQLLRVVDHIFWA